MKPTITTIINMCSGDRNFILEHVKAVRDVSEEIRIPYCNHFYTGVPENMQKIQLVKDICKSYDVKFFEFDKVVGSPAGQNMARWVGSQNIKTDYVLYMDADEIFEKNKLDDWINNFEYNLYNVITFRIHFYSIATNFQAVINEDDGVHYIGPRENALLYNRGEKAGLLVKSNLITKDRLLYGPERWIITSDPTIDKKNEHMLALDNSIMLHHYAYVRSKTEMKRKTEGFSHAHEKPWYQLIEKYFDPNFVFDPNQHLDICHGYILKNVIPPHNILSIEQFDSMYENR